LIYKEVIDNECKPFSKYLILCVMSFSKYVLKHLITEGIWIRTDIFIFNIHIDSSNPKHLCIDIITGLVHYFIQIREQLYFQ